MIENIDNYKKMWGNGVSFGMLWDKCKARFMEKTEGMVLASAIGQVSAMATDNAASIVLHDGRISDLEGYFNGATPVNAVSALGISGNTLTWSLGGTAQTPLTIPYATKALQDNNGAQIDTTYLKRAGGTMTGGLTFENAKSIYWLDNNGNSTQILYYDNQNRLRIGLDSAGKGETRLYGNGFAFYIGGTNSSDIKASVDTNGKWSLAGSMDLQGGMAAAGITNLNIITAIGTDYVTKINLGSTSYYPTDGTVSLPDLALASHTHTASDVTNLESAVEGYGFGKNIVVKAETTTSARGIQFQGPTEAPTFEAWITTGNYGLNVNRPSSGEVYGYERRILVKNGASGSRSVVVNFTAIANTKTVSLAANQYVLITYFCASSSDTPVVQMSAAMDNA